MTLSLSLDLFSPHTTTHSPILPHPFRTTLLSLHHLPHTTNLPIFLLSFQDLPSSSSYTIPFYSSFSSFSSSFLSSFHLS
ncbi:hypothetical protein E2C01_100877 [Portunus trituberculatus]|uniref:Uncharacterized protein n=1 Tax=Portunus trituberculatus TaxID=210409 RepID=A0A5B7KEP9_PORTR|nr:hypothetical protein [Portunus trituberculatus]